MPPSPSLRGTVSSPLRPAAICSLLLIALVGLVACGTEQPPPGQFEDTGVDADLPDTGDAGDAEDVGDDADAGDVDDPHTPENLTRCELDVPQPPADERCAVEPGDSQQILFYGTLLVGDEIYEDGALLIEDDAPNQTIACAGCDCADTEAADDATVVSCPDSVVSPGLINPHDHLTFAEGRPQPHGDERFDHRHDWRLGLRGHTELSTSPRSGGHREVALWGELRMLLGGATSIAGSTGGVDASGLLRNLDDPDETEGLEGIDVDYRTFPLGDAGFPSFQTSGCDYPNMDGEWRADSGIYLPHLSEGVDAAAQNELTCMAGESSQNLIRENTSIIHGIAVDARDVALIADRGANLVWSPRTNIDLYGNTAPIPLYERFGVPIALSTDWSTSGSMNMLRELECADYLDRMHFNDTFDDIDLWKMATYNAAISMGAEHKLGLLYPGYVADITVFDHTGVSPYRSIINADVDDIALVLRGGDPLYGDAAVVEGLTADDEVDECEPLDVCDRQRRACIELDTGQSLDEIEDEIHPDSYPLFFCDRPEDEPTCVPSRPSEYDGIKSPTDSSGDGVPDVIDNCPDYFNPIRPMDDGRQADVSGTGMGDVCDPCPLSQDPDCTDVDPGDWSGDGVPNDEDICPFHYNPDQQDSSGDGVGDACSPCPDHQITDDAPCPGTIYEVKTGEAPTGKRTALRDVLVTATHPDDEGLFVQVHPDDDVWDGPQFSGVYIYLGGDDFGQNPRPGDRIDVVGTITDFFGQTQIGTVTDLEVVSTGDVLPEPVAVDPEDIATGGEFKWEYEGVLVEVTDAEVTDVDVPPGPGDSAPTNEFILEEAVHVNDFFHLVDPFPRVGDLYESVTGVLRWANDNSKIEPRGPEDVELGPARLQGFDPDFAYLEVDDQSQKAFELNLERPALQARTIDLEYGDPDVVDGPESVDFAPGQQSVDVDLQALTTAPDPVSVQAQAADGDPVSAQVRTYDEQTKRVLDEIRAPRHTFFTGDTWTLEALLNVPAGADGETIELDISPDADTVYPTEITLDEGERIARFDIELGADLAIFVAIVTHGTTTRTLAFETFDAPPITSESFEHFDASSATYQDGQFVGDAGFTWEYRDARRAPASGAPAIDETSLIFADSGDRLVRAEDVPGGIAAFSVDMKQAFSSLGARQLELFVNDQSRGTSEVIGTDDSDAGEVFEFSVDDLDVAGDFDLELRSVGSRQITIDNIEWTPAGPLDDDEFSLTDVELSHFSPQPAYLEASGDPAEAVELRLAYPAIEETTVDLGYGDTDALEGPDEVTFSPGQTAAPIELQGLEARDEPVEIEASWNSSSATGEILVFDESTPRTVETLDGCPTALTDTTRSFQFSVNVPAGDDGLTVSTDVQPDDAVATQPDDVELTAGQTTAEVAVTFDGQPGSADIVVATADDEASLTVEVTDATPPLIEDFSGFTDSDAGYTDGTFVGNYGLEWAYFAADIAGSGNTIDDTSMLFGDEDSSLQIQDLPGRLDSFAVDMTKAFTNNNPRQLELIVNDQSRATSNVFGDTDDDDGIHTFEVDDLDVECVDMLELHSIATGQVTIDNVTWSTDEP